MVGIYTAKTWFTVTTQPPIHRAAVQRPPLNRAIYIRRSLNRHPTVIARTATTPGSQPSDSPASNGDKPRKQHAAFALDNWASGLQYLANSVYDLWSQYGPQFIKKDAPQDSSIAQACGRLAVDNYQALQDLCAAAILSECIYKIVDKPLPEVLSIINDLASSFPPGTVTLKTVQYAAPHVRHRFALAEGSDSIYVAFMGTKLPADYVTNVVLWQDQVELDSAILDDDEEAPLLDTASGSLAAHRGFLNRARGIPIDALYNVAQSRGKKLVLCGHSLGGSVAQLCAVSLLQRLPKDLHSTVSCYTFATPALGNEGLASLVYASGWKSRIRNYVHPDDPIPFLLSASKNSDKDTATTHREMPAVVANDDDTSRTKPSSLASLLAVAGPPVKAVASTAVRLASVPITMPMRVAQRFLPIGQQLFLLSDRVVSSSPSSRSTVLVEDSVDMDDSTTYEEDEGEEDNVDVAAALTSITVDDDDSTTIIQQKTSTKSRVLFPMHRMSTYRSDILNICHDTLGSGQLGAQRTDIVATDWLTPGMYPYSAQAYLPISFTTSTKDARQKPSWWNTITPRARTSQPIEVIIKVQGKGLDTVTSAWVSTRPTHYIKQPNIVTVLSGMLTGHHHDNDDAAAVVVAGDSSTDNVVPSTASSIVAMAQVLQKPEAPSLRAKRLQLKSRVPHITSALSWIVLKAGWLGVLKTLQPAGKHDYLIVKATIPANLIKEAQERAAAESSRLRHHHHRRHGLLARTTNLMIHLQSDFDVCKIPLEITSAAYLNGHGEVKAGR